MLFLRFSKETKQFTLKPRMKMLPFWSQKKSAVLLLQLTLAIASYLLVSWLSRLLKDFTETSFSELGSKFYQDEESIGLDKMLNDTRPEEERRILRGYYSTFQRSLSLNLRVKAARLFPCFLYTIYLSFVSRIMVGVTN